MDMAGLTLIETTWKAEKPYYKFTCTGCEEEAQNTYCEPYYTQMIDRRLCYMCNHWVEEEKRYEREHLTMTIIDGHVYEPGNRTSGNFRGMAGRRFDIEYIEPSAYAGQRITTLDLWSGSSMPDKLRAKFPDTARFLGGAEKATWPDGSLYTAAWNPSDGKEPAYPLPSSLRPNAALPATPDGGSRG